MGLYLLIDGVLLFCAVVGNILLVGTEFGMWLSVVTG